MKVLLTILAGLAIGSAVVYSTVFYLQSNQSPDVNSLSQATPEPVGELSPTLKPEPVSMRTWFAYWDESVSLERLRMVSSDIAGISPVLYYIAEDGSLAPYNMTNREEVLSVIQAREIPMTPMIGDNFDESAVQEVLYDEEAQGRFLEEIVRVAGEEGFLGWDIDIEVLGEDDREAFTAFVKAVSEALHENNLTLTMTLFAKDESDTFEGAKAQDYDAIGKYADRVQLMAYNFHNSFTDAGGQTPSAWYRSVLSYASKKVPKEKLFIGLSSHGQEWQGGETVPYTYREVQTIIGQFTATVEYNDAHLSQVAEFDDNGTSRTIWFETADTLYRKIAIARDEYGIHQFILWRLGAEDRKLWTALSSNVSTEEGEQ